MPTYPYRCRNCGNCQDVVKSMYDAGRVETCGGCGMQLDRIWTVPRAQVVQSGYYDYGLGRYINTPHDKREAFRELRDDREVSVRRKDLETGEIYNEKVVHKGVDLVEVGNEREAIRNVKPQRRQYAAPAEAVA